MARKAAKPKTSRAKSSSAAKRSGKKAAGKKAANKAGRSQISNLEREALALHRGPPPGKLSIAPLKSITTQRDLSLAYSPGVAAPCLEIAKDENTAFDYTNKGNMVAVISNGRLSWGSAISARWVQSR